MKKETKGRELKVPMDLRKALGTNAKMKAKWGELTPIARRDFVTWVESAKQIETRKRRIERTCSMLMSGKRRPCCYAVVPMNFYKALGNNPKAKKVWGSLTPTERRDFVGWVEGAKDPKKREARVEKACLMLSVGKRHPILY